MMMSNGFGAFFGDFSGIVIDNFYSWVLGTGIIFGFRLQAMLCAIAFLRFCLSTNIMQRDVVV
jgi:hypothetical protein